MSERAPALPHPPAGIPWVIALLCVFYAALATFCAATLLRQAQGVALGSPIVSAAGMALGLTLTLGLVGKREWARSLARAVSVAFAGLALWAAVAYVAAGSPKLGVAASCIAGLQMTVFYYLKRPVIKSVFGREIPQYSQPVTHRRK